MPILLADVLTPAQYEYITHEAALKILDDILELIGDVGDTDGEHHKQWLLNEILRKILGDGEAYADWIFQWQGGNGAEWDVGIAP